jgi:capsular polysaccharide biosynthesis protein
LFLGYIESRNYGSFLFRCLPKILFFKSQEIPIDYIIIPESTIHIKEFFNLVGLGNLPVYTAKQSIGIEFDSVIAINDFESGGVFCKKTNQRIKTINLPALNYQKIYVSRKLNTRSRPNYRPLVNEEQIESNLQQLGFKIIYPEILNLETQAAIFRSSKFIVGPSGSGMLNTVFAQDGAAVLDLESFTHTIAQHKKIYGSTNKRYSFHFGSFESETGDKTRRPWSVCLDDLLEKINTIENLRQ